MKETIKINLAQRLFDLDGDAYVKLKDYLDSLRAYLKQSTAEADDILSDIEQRIAELLEEKLKDTKQVVTLTDVDEIIQMMGTAEDFARESDLDEQPRTASDGDKKSYSGNYRKESRRLFRDVDHNVFGGVCAGLSAYFNVDAIWIRIAFVILFFINFIGFIIYVILWALVPAAITTAQKLQMQGKPVNIGNIQDSVKSEFNKVKDNFGKFRDSDGYQRARDTTNEALHLIGNILLVFLKVILVIIGIGIAFAGLAILISLLVAVTAGGFWSGWNIPEYAWGDHVLHLFQNVTFFSFAVFLVIMIPIVGILSGIIRMVFNLKKKNNVLAAFGWTIWSLALVFVIITLAMGLNRTSFGHHYKEVKTIQLSKSTTLYLRLDEQSLPEHNLEYFTVFGREIIRDRWDDDLMLKPEIEILSSNDQNIKLEMEYMSFIPWDDQDDYDLYHFAFRDSLLILENYWRVDEDEMWRLPKLKLKLYLPDGQKIHIDTDFEDLRTSSADNDPWPAWYYRNKLRMEQNSLKLAE